jgi:hypothetical protein
VARWLGVRRKSEQDVHKPDEFARPDLPDRLAGGMVVPAELALGIDLEGSSGTE